MKHKWLSLAFTFTLFMVQSLAEKSVIFHERVSHSEARRKCKAEDGVLAKLDKKDHTIGSEPQDYQDRLREDVWIGLIRDGNGWKWLDGSRLGSWNNWRVKEPSRGEDFKDCVELQMFRDSSGTKCSHWKVKNCNESKGYICTFFENECILNNPCQHGGRCIFNTADGSTSCNCSATGYQGIKCTECQEGGNCSDSCHCLRKEECGTGSCHSGCQAGRTGPKCLLPEPNVTRGLQAPTFAYTPPATGDSQPAYGPAAIPPVPGPAAIPPAPGPAAVHPVFELGYMV